MAHKQYMEKVMQEQLGGLEARVWKLHKQLEVSISQFNVLMLLSLLNS